MEFWTFLLCFVIVAGSLPLVFIISGILTYLIYVLITTVILLIGGAIMRIFRSIKQVFDGKCGF